jgi:hypothetical protein
MLCKKQRCPAMQCRRQGGEEIYFLSLYRGRGHLTLLREGTAPTHS